MMEHHQTKPEDRIPLHLKLVYGLGAFVNNLLGAAIGSMMIVLNLGLGMNPALVGLLGALPRVLDAFTDPLMGYISDGTKSRWGRRRPYIFVGVILAGVIFALLWQLPTGKSESFYFWFFLAGSMLFYLAYTMFATPWVALGYELTPDYHERTRVMAVQNFIGQFAWLVAPWFLWAMQHETFDDMVEGASYLAIAIAVTCITIGILPAIFLRERLKDASGGSMSGGMLQIVKDFFTGFAAALKFSPFLKLCVATFMVFNGFMMVASFQNYVIIYYVFGGDTAMGAKFAGYAGSVAAFSTFCVIFFVSWMSSKIGKRRAFFVSTGASMVGYSLKWFCYSPENPYLLLLPAPLIAFGLGGLFTLMGAMIADVCDADELESEQRREGMFGSIYWWVVKLGMAAALAVGGYLLNATGFDVALGGNQTEHTIFLMRLFDVTIPVVGSAIALWMVATYPITEARAYEVRTELEARREAAAIPATEG